MQAGMFPGEQFLLDWMCKRAINRLYRKVDQAKAEEEEADRAARLYEAEQRIPRP